MIKMLNKLFRKEGAFAPAVFADSRLSLDCFDERHLVYQRHITGMWRPKPVLYQADSFLFVKDDTLYLFYELQHWDLYLLTNPTYHLIVSSILGLP